LGHEANNQEKLCIQALRVGCGDEDATNAQEMATIRFFMKGISLSLGRPGISLELYRALAIRGMNITGIATGFSKATRSTASA
jgi:hypothetical protein